MPRIGEITNQAYHTLLAEAIANGFRDVSSYLEYKYSKKKSQELEGLNLIPKRLVLNQDHGHLHGTVDSIQQLIDITSDNHHKKHHNHSGEGEDHILEPDAVTLQDEDDAHAVTLNQPQKSTRAWSLTSNTNLCNKMYIGIGADHEGSPAQGHIRLNTNGMQIYRSGAYKNPLNHGDMESVGVNDHHNEVHDHDGGSLDPDDLWSIFSDGVGIIGGVGGYIASLLFGSAVSIGIATGSLVFSGFTSLLNGSDEILDESNGYTQTTIDAKFTSHKNSSEHDGRYYTETEIEALFNIGSGNADDYVCLLRPHETFDYVGFNYRYRHNSTGSNMYMYFDCSLPTNRGGKKLYITNIKIGLEDADASSYIDFVELHGCTYNSDTTLHQDLTNKTTPAALDYSFTAVDCSGYDRIYIKIDNEVVNANDIEIAYVKVTFYYDT